MPRKSGKLTPGERVLATAYAATGDKSYARYKAGMSAISGGAERALSRPAVQAEIVRIQTKRLFDEALPLAIDRIVNILQADKAPAGAQVQAAKLVFDRTLGLEGAGTTKDPHEMSGEELARAIEELKRMASDRAKPVIDVGPVESDVFE